MRKLFIAFLVCCSLPTYAPPTHIDWGLVKEVDHYYKDLAFYETEFSTESFYEAMVFVGIQHPEIVLRQSIIETGWFKSRVFLELNNLFGMHFPIHRETTAIGWDWADYYNGSHHKMSKYENWYGAVKDYKLWQDYWIKEELKEEHYYQFLIDLPYAASKNYVRTLKSIDIQKLVT